MPKIEGPPQSALIKTRAADQKKHKPLTPFTMAPITSSSGDPDLGAEAVAELTAAFSEWDLDKDGRVDAKDLPKMCKGLGEAAGYDQVLNAFRDGRPANPTQATLEEFIKLVGELRRGQPAKLKLKPVDATPRSNESSPRRISMTKNITVLAGATGSSQHSLDEDELAQFVLHINQVLSSLESWDRPAIEPPEALFAACRDGLVLSQLVNDSVPDTIDERVLNRKANGGALNAFQMTENNNVVINSAKALGCSVVNIGSQDLIEGREHLVLGLVWQIIKIGLLAKISLEFHPELYRLLEPGEDLEALLGLPADVLLLRWVNHHLREASSPLRITNFTGDIKDSQAYTILLAQLCPGECDRSPLNESDLAKRAEAMLQGAGRVGCRKYLTPKAVLAGNPKLNLAFVANLFNHHPGLAKLTHEELAALDERLFSAEGDREARAFALWMNSLGVDPFVNRLYDDLRDGRVLLQVMDKIRPGSVNWKRATRTAPMIRFKAIENTNMVVEMAKAWRFSLVGIQGADITDGSRTLTLGLVWQLMRENIVATLSGLASDSKEIRDQDMVDWANSLVKTNKKGKAGAISGFKDASLKTGVYLLELLAALQPGLINKDLVTPGLSESDAKLNAKYAISAARKLGATIFCLPEDIWEVRPKLILTFVGSLMVLQRAGLLQPQAQ